MEEGTGREEGWSCKKRGDQAEWPRVKQERRRGREGERRGGRARSNLGPSWKEEKTESTSFSSRETDRLYRTREEREAPL